MPNSPITNTQRDEVYDRSNETVRTLWAAPESGEALRTIFTKHGLNAAYYRQYAIAVGDVILGFYKQSDLPQLLKSVLGIDDAKAIRVTADLLDFLAPLNDIVPPTQTATATPMEAPDNSIASDIAEAEAVLAHIAPVRTMARDMHDLKSQDDDAPTYRSSQNLTTTPPPPPAQPRWGSES